MASFQQYENRQLVRVSDQDNQGLDDFVVGGIVTPAFPGGSTQFLSGSTGLPISSALGPFGGGSLSDDWGSPVVSLGDLDNDGDDEIWIASFSTANNNGAILVFRGTTFSLMATITVSGGDFGRTVRKIADLNGDGVGDVLIGATAGGANGQEQVFAVSGSAIAAANGGVLTIGAGVLYPVPGPGVFGDEYGESIAPLDDVNGDGVPDFGVLADEVPFAHIVSGASGSPLFVVSPLRPAGAPTMELRSAGDLNGDGVGDLILSHSFLPPMHGILTAYSGVTGLQRWTTPAQTSFSFFGAIFDAGEDLSGDGTPDIVCYASDNQTGQDLIAAVRGFDGSFLGTSPTASGATIAAEPMKFIGDQNADGLSEVAVGTIDVTTGSQFTDILDLGFLLPRYPGSGDDLEIATGVNGPLSTTPDRKSASPGNGLLVHFESPNGTFSGAIPFLAASLIGTGSSIPTVVGFPEIHLDLTTTVVIYDDANAPFGIGILPSTGMTFGFVVPALASGTSAIFQAGVLAPSQVTSNPLFTVTNGHKIQVP
ncbi:MAG: FG-GAP repeat protein [Planctomycetes bacterium]|nr:FG-GAP repeat protein [Planctomycetota bacterium]